MDYIFDSLKAYFEYAPYFFIAFLSAFLITPLVGFVAYKLKILDIPASLRKPTDPSKITRMKTKPVPRAGSLAVIIPFIILALVAAPIDRQIIAIILGVIILTVVGLLDDKYEVNSKWQMSLQLIVALITVAAGISIDSIQNPFGADINLRGIVLPFQFAGDTLSIALPADILTVIWILILINSINWVFGVDGLGEGISFIAFMTIVLVSVKYTNPLTALLASIASGGILGFLPFNFPPSKIISGSSVVVYGFLIAVLSIIGGAKVSISVIVLAIPLLDMIWVIIGRINRRGLENISDIFKVTMTGDDSHLHHRLMKLGFSVLQISIVEWMAVCICAVIAFTTADLPKVTMVSIIFVVILIVFLIISILLKSKFRINRRKRIVRKQRGEGRGSDETPESRYAY